MNDLPRRLKAGFLAVSLFAFLACAATAQAQNSWGNNATDLDNNAKDMSDLNGDGVIDILDLSQFSTNYLRMPTELVDWCAFYDAAITGNEFEGRSTRYYVQHFRLLLTFVDEEFQCSADPGPGDGLLKLENDPKFLVRIAAAKDGSGNFYFTDSKVGSVFIYDNSLQLTHELKGLDKPLGIGVDSQGYIYVGNDGRDNIEVYDPANGNLMAIFAQGQVFMPTAITFGPEGNIYVTDSRAHAVKVFDPDFNLIQTIGSPGSAENELNFPMDAEIISFSSGEIVEHEIFIADQGNYRIQIFDLDGNHLGNINPGRCGWFGGCNPPVLKRLQALSKDTQGRLHALDIFEVVISVLDSGSGALISSYGEYGDGQGYLKFPMDMLVTNDNRAIVTTGDGARFEVLAIP